MKGAIVNAPAAEVAAPPVTFTTRIPLPCVALPVPCGVICNAVGAPPRVTVPAANVSADEAVAFTSSASVPPLAT